MRKGRRQLLFVVSLLTYALTGSTSTHSQSFDEFKKQLVSPWGYQDRKGVDAIGETLLSPADREKLGYWFYQQDVLGSIAAAEDSTFWQRMGGYTVKGLGRGVDAALDKAGDLGGAIEGGFPLEGLSIAGPIVGGAIEDWGESIVKHYEDVATARVLIALENKYDKLVRPNGTLDEAAVRRIDQSDFGKALRDPKVIEDIGNPAVVAAMTSRMSADLIVTSLRGIDLIKNDTSAILVQLGEAKKGLDVITGLQKSAVQIEKANAAALETIDSKVSKTGTLVETLVRSQLPPDQVLALYNRGLLALDPKDIKKLELDAEIKKYKVQLAEASGYFKGASQAFAAFGDEDLARATAQMGTLVDAAGGFSIAVAAGQPWAIFTSGASLLAAFKGLGGGKTSTENGALVRIMQELRQLSEQMRAYHQEEMSLLRKIDLKIDNLQATVSQRFIGLGLDVSLVQFDVRELLYDDVRECDSLATEVRLPQTLELFKKGLLGFAIWFEADNRPVAFTRCLDGLLSRQRVASEIDFSGMLRATETGNGVASLSADARRDAVRRIELRVLQPTVAYLNFLNRGVSGEEIASRLYRVFSSLCDSLVEFGDPALLSCTQAGPTSLDSDLTYSQFNAGQGALLSARTALLMAKYTRLVAPWNGVLTEKTSSSTPRVLSEREARTRSSLTMSRRTRHVAALKAALDALDLNIGQSNVLSGLAAAPHIAKILDEKVIPSYAKARLAGDTSDINRLLAMGDPNRNLDGPQCTTGNESFDALCAMEANPELAQNAIRLFIAIRLHRANATFDDWRRALRSPFSRSMQKLLGRDVLFKDTGGDMPGSTFGVWSIELPRVYADPQRGRPLADKEAELLPRQSCWQTGIVPWLYDADGGVDEKQSYYSRQFSSRCNVLDSFTVDDFSALQLPDLTQALLAERYLVAGLLHQLCTDNKYYPAEYCSRSRRPLAPTVDVAGLIPATVPK